MFRLIFLENFIYGTVPPKQGGYSPSPRRGYVGGGGMAGIPHVQALNAFKFC